MLYQFCVVASTGKPPFFQLLIGQLLGAGEGVWGAGRGVWGVVRGVGVQGWQ